MTLFPCTTDLIEEASPLRLGPFTLGKTIGSGTFAKVKAAIDERNGSCVAIKILNRQQIKRMDVVAKLKHEIKVQSMLNHPHIVRSHQTICTPTHIFIVMEHLNGGEFFDYLSKRGKLNECEGRRFIQQLISGVDYCHRHMVVHRDLKPENLLLDERCNLKITDFGLANTLMDGDFMTTSCGSPNYAAPEVISGALYAGPEVDIWSCGIILFAILCGFLPFDDDNVSRLFRKIKSGIFPIPKYLTKGALNLISQMLQVDPTKRISMLDIIDHEWFKKDLPPYLFYHIYEPQTILVDAAALEGACRNVSCSMEEMQEALMSGDPQNSLSIAYDLVCTKRQIAEVKRLQHHLSAMDLSNASRDSIEENGDFFGNLTRSRCHERPPSGSPFCRPNCDLCPTWGATQCLFGYNVPSLAKCDSCAQKRYDPGCIFSSAKLSPEKVREAEASMKKSPPGRPREDSSACCSAAKVMLQCPADYCQKRKHHGENIQNSDPIFGPTSPALPPQAQTESGPAEPAKTAGAELLATAKVGRKRYRWHLGVRAKAQPIDVMLEVFRALKAADFVWQIITPYHIIVKLRNGSVASENCQGRPIYWSYYRPPLFSQRASHTIDEVRISLQLYEVDRSTYLLDFKSMAMDGHHSSDGSSTPEGRGSPGSVSQSRRGSIESRRGSIESRRGSIESQSSKQGFVDSTRRRASLEHTMSPLATSSPQPKASSSRNAFVEAEVFLEEEETSAALNGEPPETVLPPSQTINFLLVCAALIQSLSQ